MKLTFLRHGTTDLNGKGYIATTLDYPINENGIHECKKMKFNENDFDAVYCTPYKRTIQTAEIVYPYKKATITPLISQRDLGELNEKFQKDYTKEYLEEVRNYTLVPLNAESLDDIKNRLDDFFKYIKNNHNSNEKILIVGHNGIMRIIKKYYMNENTNIDTNNLGKFDFYLEEKSI